MALYPVEQQQNWSNFTLMKLSSYGFGMIGFVLAMDIVVLPVLVSDLAPAEWKNTYLTILTFSGLMVAGLAVPTALGPVERAWMAFARSLSKVTTPIVMGIVYFLVIFPIGFAMRILNRSPLAVKATNDSFWVPRAGEEDRRGGMKHQF